MNTPSQGFKVQEFINQVLASGDIRRRVYISFGAMNNVFPFLEPKVVLSMQAVSKFMYHRGVERFQAKFFLKPSMLFFAYTATRKWARTLFVYNVETQMPMSPVVLDADLGVSFNESAVS